MSSIDHVDDTVATKVRLLDASERLFAERGFAGASVRDIAESSGCNLAAVNYHFSSKENLYHEVMLRRMRQLREMRLGVLAELMQRFPDGTNLDAVLRGYAEAILRSQREPASARRLLQLFAREFLDPRLPAGTFQRELMEPIETGLAAAILRARPDLSAADARLCTHSLLAQLVYLAQLPRATEDPTAPGRPSVDWFVDHVARFTTAGVAGYVPRSAAPVSDPGAARSADTNKWLVAITVLVGAIMAVLDSSIVNVALPSMSGTLGVTVEEITWVVTGYILSQVIVMPITGMLSLRFGRKNFYMFSVVLFTVASMLCGLARTLPLMVIFRVFQGFGGGVLLTVSQAILRETFPAEQQGVAMGLYGMGVVVAPALGPTLGGWLTDQYSWPWIFLVNVPVGVLNVFLVARYIQDPPYLKREKGRIDWAGLGLMTLGLGTLLLMLEKGEKYGWLDSNLIVALGAVAAVSLTLFFWQELRLSRPAVNVRLLKNRSLASATALGAVLGMGLYGSLFLLPVFLQNLLGYTAMMSGQALIPRSLAMAVVMPISGRLYNQLGPRPLVLAGLLVSAWSFWELSRLTLAVSFWDIFWPQMWQGVGFGLIFVALSTAALATIPRAQMTEATGMYNVVRQVFGSVGITVSALLLSRSALTHHAVLAEHVTATSLPAQRFLQGAAGALRGAGDDPHTAQLGALKLMNYTLGRQAAVLAFNDVFTLIVILFLAGLPLALFLRKTRMEADTDFAPD